MQTVRCIYAQTTHDGVCVSKAWTVYRLEYEESSTVTDRLKNNS